jgi:hypothetical protein
MPANGELNVNPAEILASTAPFEDIGNGLITVQEAVKAYQNSSPWRGADVWGDAFARTWDPSGEEAGSGLGQTAGSIFGQVIPGVDTTGGLFKSSNVESGEDAAALAAGYYGPSGPAGGGGRVTG